MKRVGEEAASGLVSGAISVASGAGSDEAKEAVMLSISLASLGESPLESPKNVVDSKKTRSAKPPHCKTRRAGQKWRCGVCDGIKVSVVG